MANLNINESESRDSGSNTGAVIGGVVGGLVVVAVGSGRLVLATTPLEAAVANSEPSPSDPVGHFAITCG